MNNFKCKKRNFLNEREYFSSIFIVQIFSKTIVKYKIKKILKEKEFSYKLILGYNGGEGHDGQIGCSGCNGCSAGLQHKDWLWLDPTSQSDLIGHTFQSFPVKWQNLSLILLAVDDVLNKTIN